MGYVYVVTTIKNTSPGIRHIPNLGIHSNLGKALRHFRSVYDDRAKNGSVTMIAYNNPKMNKNAIPEMNDRYVLVQSAITHDDEEIRLEKWIVR